MPPANFPEGFIAGGTLVGGGFAKTLFVGSASGGHQTASSGENYETPAPTLLSVFKNGVVDTADRGTLIVVRKGHTESISAADYFSLIGSRKRITIRGEGEGLERGTLTWTTATSTWLFDTDSIRIENLNLNLEPGTGTVNVAAPFTVSAAGCAITDCLIKFGTDANNKVTIGITTTAAGDDFQFHRNKCYGATAAECTTFMQLVGADRLAMHDNVIEGASSAVGVGIVRFATTASLNIDLKRNSYVNRKALSTAAVTGLAGVSGVSRDEHFAYLDTASLTPWLTSTGIMTFHRPTVTNTAGETGTEVVGTVSA